MDVTEVSSRQLQKRSQHTDSSHSTNPSPVSAFPNKCPGDKSKFSNLKFGLEKSNQRAKAEEERTLAEVGVRPRKSGFVYGYCRPALPASGMV